MSLLGREHFTPRNEPRFYFWRIVFFSVFRFFKVFRLHAILHDATGAVYLTTAKDQDTVI